MSKTKPTDHYVEDQTPCILMRKTCGCYVAACAIDEEELTGLAKWVPTSDLDSPAIVDFLREGNSCGATFEMRPVSFVRKGGLNFSCRCILQEGKK